MTKLHVTRRAALLGAAALGAAAPLSRPALAAASTTIKIGALNVYTKAGGVYGQAILDGMQLYLDQVGGKIAGRTVELIKEDDEFSPQVALQKARKLVESDGCQVMAGPLGSQIATAILSYMRRTGCPWIVTGAGATELTKSHLPHMFRATLSNWQVASPMGTWAVANLKKDSAIIASDYLAGHDIGDAFKDTFTKGGGRITQEIYTPVGTNDFAAYISQLGGNPASMTYVFYSGSDAVNFVKQWGQFGMDKKSELIAFQSTLDADTFAGQGDAALGGISTSIYCDELDTPENKDYVALFRKKTGRYPGVFDESGYTAMRIIGDAAQAVAGDVENRDAFSAALAKTNIVAPRGPISFDPVTHQAIQNVYVRKVVKLDGMLRNTVLATLPHLGDYPPNQG